MYQIFVNEDETQTVEEVSDSIQKQLPQSYAKEHNNHNPFCVSNTQNMDTVRCDAITHPYLIKKPKTVSQSPGPPIYLNPNEEEKTSVPTTPSQRLNSDISTVSRNKGGNSPTLLLSNIKPYCTKLNSLLKEEFSMVINYHNAPEKLIKLYTIPLRQHHTHKNKKTLILDLDGTLICSLSKAKDIIPSKIRQANTGQISFQKENGKIGKHTFCIRPFLNNFLRKMRVYYEIIVFSASKGPYANAIVNYLDPKKTFISYVLNRQNCLNYNGVSVKDLRVLGNRKLERCIIVDNSVSAFAANLDNGIFIPTFEGSLKDDELLILANFLTLIADVKDVRPYIQKFSGINELLARYKCNTV